MTKFDKAITRKELVAAGALTSFGLLLAACGGNGSETSSPAPAASPTPEDLPEPSPTPAPSEEAPLKQGLAEGMYGGPTGFEGAERYQYPFDSEEGRAISALRRLRRDGIAPDSLVVQVDTFFRPQLETPYAPEGPSFTQLFEDETGIRIRLIEVNFIDPNLQAAETRDGSFDVVGVWTVNLGTMAETGLLRPLDDFVEAHRPSWLDPRLGYAGGERIVKFYNTYKGQTYRVALDNDIQPVAYRADLLENEVEQARFEDRYGRELRFPLTWDEQADVAAFFTRPNDNPPLYGSVERKFDFSGWVNWANRLLPSEDPDFFYLADDGAANVNNEAGIRATEEHKRSLQWSEPGAVDNPFEVQFELMTGGTGFMGGTWPATFRLFPGLPFGFKAEISPGRLVDGGLLRRSTEFAGPGGSVNAFAQKSRHEAAYLYLQWAGSARINAWLTSKAESGLDPLHTYSLTDPGVATRYGKQPLEKMGEIMPRTVPGVMSLDRSLEYQDILRGQLRKHLTDQQSAERTMKNVEEGWNALTEEIGVERQVGALAHLRRAFPTVVDDPTTA